MVVIKRVALIIYSFLLIVLLVLGIVFADYNTRAIAYKDATPVFNVSIEEDIVSLNIFDKSMKLNVKGNYLSVFTDVYKKSAPYGKQSVRALINVIEKIVDRFRQVFDL